MYPNSSIFIKFIVGTYAFITGLTIIIFKRSFWPVVVPAEIAVSDKEKTKKDDYMYEKYLYRLVHDVIMSNQVKKSYYWRYRLIAEKYNWPYVTETYDNLPRLEKVQAVQLPKDPNLQIKHSVPFTKLFWYADLAICLLVMVNFLANDTYPGDVWYVNLGLALLMGVMLQIFFIPGYFVYKFCHLWAAKVAPKPRHIRKLDSHSGFCQK